MNNEKRETITGDNLVKYTKCPEKSTKSSVTLEPSELEGAQTQQMTAGSPIKTKENCCCDCIGHCLYCCDCALACNSCFTCFTICVANLLFHT